LPLKMLAMRAHFNIARQALYTLGKHTPNHPDFFLLVEPLLQHSDPRFHTTALKALRINQNTHPKLFTYLKKLRKASQWAIREEVVRALHRFLQLPPTRSWLAQALKDEDPHIRIYALRGLLKLLQERSQKIRLLQTHLLDPARRVQRVAAELLHNAFQVPRPHALQRAMAHAKFRLLQQQLSRQSQHILQSWIKTLRKTNLQILTMKHLLHRFPPKERILFLKLLLQHPYFSLQKFAAAYIQEYIHSHQTTFTRIFLDKLATSPFPRYWKQRLSLRIQQYPQSFRVPIHNVLHGPSPRHAKKVCAWLKGLGRQALPFTPALIHTLYRRYTWLEAQKTLKAIGPSVADTLRKRYA
ncbi:MAG: HEAT repeat domain-containing protein, partial [Myxococcota bacterium]